MSHYPVGAAWIAEGISVYGGVPVRVRIWLDERDGNFEVWRWRCSGYRGDWNTSRRLVRNECPTVLDTNGNSVRFKRVKESPDDPKV